MMNLPKPSTTANLAIDSLTNGIIPPRTSLSTSQLFKKAISEITTAYNQILGGLTLRLGQLFPISEHQHEL